MTFSDEVAGKVVEKLNKDPQFRQAQVPPSSGSPPPPPSKGQQTASDVKIVRITVDSSSDPYLNKYTLPKDCAAWRMVNEGLGNVRWALKDLPSTKGEDSYSLLLGKGADQPGIIPAFLKREVKLWFRLDTASDPASDIVIIYTTSNDPNAISTIAAGGVTFGIPQQDIEIGAVELKDGSGDQRVTVVSGSDGIKYIKTDISGAIVQISGQVVQISGIAVEISGDVVTVGSGVVGLAGDLGNRIIGVRPNNLLFDTTTSGFAILTAAASYLQVSGQVATGGDNALYPLYGELWNKSMGARDYYPGGSPYLGTFTFARLYGRRRTAPNQSLVATQEGLVVHESGELVTVISDGSGLQLLTITSGGDGVRYVETDVSGSVATAGGRVLGTLTSSVAVAVSQSGAILVGGTPAGGTSAIPVLVDSSGRVLTTVVSDPAGALVFSGVVTQVSGTVQSGRASVSFSPPAARFQADARYLVSIWHGALSADLNFIVSKTTPFGGNVRTQELTNVTLNRSTSGSAFIVQGMFVNQNSGLIVMVNNQALVENVTGEITIERL